MRARSTLGGIAATALLFLGAGAGSAAAQTAVPNTGAAPCTDTNFHQYTKYHGLICYSNAGGDNLGSSGFWTYAYYSPNACGWIGYYANGSTTEQWEWFAPSPSLKNFSDVSDNGLVSMVELDIIRTNC